MSWIESVSWLWDVGRRIIEIMGGCGVGGRKGERKEGRRDGEEDGKSDVEE